MSSFLDFIEESEVETVKRVQEATRQASFDYRIYEELKEIKREIRQQRAVANLAKILKEEGDQTDEEGKNGGKEEEEEDEFSMEISFGENNDDGAGYGYYEGARDEGIEENPMDYLRENEEHDFIL